MFYDRNFDLTNRFEENEEYRAWKFPGGELHIKIKHKPHQESFQNVLIKTSIESSDDLLLLCLTIDALKNVNKHALIDVFIGYMAYQQADRRFNEYECFSLKTICNILNSLDVNQFFVFDPHSDVTPALLNNCVVIDNREFIGHIIKDLNEKGRSITILSPDAGAYKKIFKLADNIGFKGRIECANKYRNGLDLEVRLSCDDFNGSDVMIIDDICVGGRTFIQLADALSNKNVGHLYLAVSHGIFSNGLTELGVRFYNVFTTDTRSDVKELKEYHSDLLKIYTI